MRLRRKRDMTRAELLDALRALARNIEVRHEHVVRQEPIPKPESAIVVFKHIDGSESYRYPIICGRQAYTHFQVPMTALDPEASPGQIAHMEFRWDR